MIVLCSFFVADSVELQVAGYFSHGSASISQRLISVRRDSTLTLMDARFWSVMLCFLMVVAVFLEVLTPSMGAFTFIALALGVGSAWAGFHYSESMGWLMSAIDLGLFPVTLYIGIIFLKRSPLMHKGHVHGSHQNAPDALPLTELIGQHGRSITPLRPAGAALIGSRRLDVVTAGKFVDPNMAIKVIQVEGNRIVVEQVADSGV
jgi:membrane-bound serine protease (ClpP class)